MPPDTVHALTLNDDECALIAEALGDLITKKRDALRMCISELPKLHARQPFRPDDFGIPRLEALIRRVIEIS